MGLWHEGARAWAPLLEIEPELKERLDEEDRKREEEANTSKQSRRPAD